MESMDKYLIEQTNKLIKLGYEVKIVRLGDWANFHIKKDKRPNAYYPLPTHNTIQIFIKENPKDKRQNNYLIQNTGLFENKNYNYGTFEKFKKGFERNIMKPLIEYIK